MEDEALPFHTKNIIPENSRDKGLFVFMVAVIPTIFFWEIWMLYQYHDSLNFSVCLNVIFLSFIFTNITGNLYYLKRIDASGKQKKLPCILKPGWRYCHTCQLNSPPRSYHCPICNECILKRDRHCMFAGCCIGFHNHRYYLLSVFYVLIGASYAFFYQFNHYIETVGGFSFSTLLTVIGPHIALLTGFLTIYGFIITVTQIILFLSASLTSYLLIQQILGVLHGQTRHERLENIYLYDLGVYKNFMQIVGRQWYLAILLPFFASKMPGDGLNFMNASDIEDIKDV